MPRSSGRRRRDRAGSRSLLFSALAVVALLAAGCAPSHESADRAGIAEGAPVEGGTVVFAEPTEPRELNCIRASDNPTTRICRQIFDSLVDHDAALNPTARLAESWDASPDGTSLTFHLRRGVRWHDGRPFTARDVLYTIDQIRAKDGRVMGNRRALLEPMVSIEAPDDWTIVTRYREPYALAFQAWAKVFVAPAHLPYLPGATSPTDRAPVGTGPWRIARWDAQQSITLEANRDYFGGRPHLDRLVFRYIPDVNTIAAALRTGDIDLAGLPQSLAPGDDTGLPFRLERYSAQALDFIVWNVREPRGLFADARVRRAMALAFDRTSYIREVVHGFDRAAVSSFDPSTWAHDPALPPLPHDPAAAARLLAEAGWRDKDGDGVLDTAAGPASFTLLFISGNPIQEKIAVLFQSAAKPLGIEVRLTGLEWPVLKDKVYSHAFEATTYRWGLDVDPDPYDFFHTSEWPSGQNLGGYSNPDVDRMMEEGRRTLDVGARAAIYRRLERLIRDEQPYLFISHPGTALGVSRRLRGVRIGASGAISWYPATLLWWIPAPLQGPPR